MKTTSLLFVAIAFAVVFSIPAKADVLVSEKRNELPKYVIQILNSEGNPAWKYGDGVSVREKSQDDSFRIFCSDLYTSTSESFNGEGQTYLTSSLANSMLHDTVQKTQLQSLFDHVYTKAYNDDYSMNDPLYASIFQLAVWEIVHDGGIGGNLSISEGNIQYLGAAILMEGGWYNPDYDMSNLIQSTLDEWFDAIFNDNWDIYGYDYDPVTLTVWTAEGGSHVSQTFIGVDPRSTVPEPATLAIISLGLAGVGLAARRRMQK